MQIGPNKLLSFLPGSTQPLAPQAGDKDTSTSRASARSASAASTAALPDATPAQDDAGVILAIQSEASGAAAVPKDLVYSNARKSAVPADDSSDTERMARRHQQALERMAGSSSNQDVSKDGVLLAEPASPAEIKERQFMHFAVNAMREYADTQDRLKTMADKTDASAPATTSLVPRSLAEVQKLAARFKLFA
jgi:hypothetical protein